MFYTKSVTKLGDLTVIPEENLVPETHRKSNRIFIFGLKCSAICPVSRTGLSDVSEFVRQSTEDSPDSCPPGKG